MGKYVIFFQRRIPSIQCIFYKNVEHKSERVILCLSALKKITTEGCWNDALLMKVLSALWLCIKFCHKLWTLNRLKTWNNVCIQSVGHDSQIQRDFFVARETWQRIYINCCDVSGTYGYSVTGWDKSWNEKIQYTGKPKLFKISLQWSPQRRLS